MLASKLFSELFSESSSKPSPYEARSFDYAALHKVKHELLFSSVRARSKRKYIALTKLPGKLDRSLLMLEIVLSFDNLLFGSKLNFD